MRALSINRALQVDVKMFDAVAKTKNQNQKTLIQSTSLKFSEAIAKA